MPLLHFIIIIPCFFTFFLNVFVFIHINIDMNYSTYNTHICFIDVHDMCSHQFSYDKYSVKKVKEKDTSAMFECTCLRLSSSGLIFSSRSIYLVATNNIFV